jgi:hypothetical protein
MANEFDNIGSTAYNQYKGFPLLGYTCVTHLLSVNETIFKLLYYTDPDAWNKSNLSTTQKTGLIYQGQEQMEDYHIFFDAGQSDAWTKESTSLRIYPYDISPQNRTIGVISMAFEVYSHYRINHLSNYATRTDTIIQQLIEEFNGFDLGEVGKLQFNRGMGGIAQKMTSTGQTPYKGKYLIMSTKSGTGIQGTGV